jgi:hypothetical protein
MASSSSSTSKSISRSTSRLTRRDVDIEELTNILYPPTLQTKLANLVSNLHKNHERPKGMGYIIDGIVCQGAIGRLSDCFYGNNFKPPVKRRGKSLSSRAWGANFHRRIFHQYKCLGGSCLCKSRFGKTSRKIKENSDMDAHLKSFENFLNETGWKVFDCELVVGWKDMKHATALDVVCVDDVFHPTEFFVIELKTGYPQRYQARTIDGSGLMKGACGKKIVNSYANHHQLQLWFGMECLQRTYDIKATNGVVLYIKSDGKYKADYAAPWWFNNTAMKKGLIDQLSGNISTFSLY